jgi:hypothetical protein
VLKYKELPSSSGSARHFQKGDDDPLTFHEPHGGKTLKQGTLTEYLRKLGIDRETFMAALGGVVNFAVIANEDKFLRKELSNGVFVSNCLTCCELIATGPEEALTAAEASHACPTTLSMN